MATAPARARRRSRRRARRPAAGRGLRRRRAAGLGGRSSTACTAASACPSVPPTECSARRWTRPRGRVYLMRARTEGRIGLTENFVLHMDRCLGCRACETACPAGVPFGRLIEETRGQIERQVPRPLGRRLLGKLVLGVFPERQRLARLLTLTRLYQRPGLQRLVRGTGLLRRFPRVQAMERLLPTLPPTPSGAGCRPRRFLRTAARGEPSRCWRDASRPSSSPRSTARRCASWRGPGTASWCPHGAGLLRRASSPLGRPDAPGAAAGPPEPGRLRGADWVVTNAAGCGAALRDYGHLLEDDPRRSRRGRRASRDVTELLAEHLPEPRRPLDLTVTYHEPCHLAHGQRVREAPRAILRAIPGLRLVELPESDLCCGSAGVYNLMEPEIAGQLLERKLDRIAGTGAGVVASGNPGLPPPAPPGAGRPRPRRDRSIIRWSSWPGRSRGPGPRRGAEPWPGPRQAIARAVFKSSLRDHARKGGSPVRSG